MIVSLKWLKDYVDLKIDSKNEIQELCNKLTDCGLEVASVECLDEKYKNIVTAEILEKKSHPNADKLSLCSVTTGDEKFSVVCGANNHKKGDKVLLAKIGSRVYVDDPQNTFTIKRSKIRGETSEGMLCSPGELGLQGDNSGIIILPKAD